MVKKKWKSHLGPHSPSLSVIISRHGWFMRLKRLRSCNQRVLSYSMPAERVWDCEGESAFSPAGPTQDTQTSSPDEGKECQSILITRALQSKLYIRLWTREVIGELWLARDSLWLWLWNEVSLCGVAAAAKFEMCGHKAIWEIIGCEFVFELAKQAALKTFSNERGGLRIWIGVRWCSDLTSLWWPCSKIQLKSWFCMDFYQPKPV